MCTVRFVTMMSALLLSLTFASSDAAVPGQPDFAYPKTVSAQAEKSLDDAILHSDNVGIVRSLMDFYLAQTSIGADNTPKALSRIADVCREADDESLKAMLYLLQADIYNGIYRGDRWKYDGRDIPLLPIPDNYKLWSGGQFKHRIISLIDSALSFAPQLEQVPLKDYARVINADAHTYIYYPTLYDFVASRSIGILEGFSQNNRVFSWGLLVPHDIYLESPFPKSDAVATRILELYASLLRVNSGKVAATINTDISRIAFINNRIYQVEDSSPDRLLAILRALYEENRSSEYSGDILCFIADKCSGYDSKWLYDAIGYNLGKFPAYWRNSCLLNIKNQLSCKSVSITTPSTVSPGMPVSIDVSLENLNNVALRVYDVSASPIYNDGVRFKDAASRKLIATLDASVKGNIPFSGETSVKYTFSKVGNYIVVPVIDGVEQTDRSYSKIHVTHYSIGVSYFKDRRLWVVDAVTGKPVSDAQLTVYKDLNNYRMLPIPVSVGKTSSDGSHAFAETGNAVVEKDGDKYARPLFVHDLRNQSVADWSKATAGFAALPIYHPGDTVQWTAVCYGYKGKTQRLYGNVAVKAVMRDASYTPVDTVTLVTDEYGRVNGSFPISKDCLTGRFVIIIDEYGTAVSFEVSDYKLPTFRVELLPVEKDYPSKGDVTLRGKVVTYSGFPLPDVKVTADISVAPHMRWWWNRSRGVSFNSCEATTTADGAFEMAVEASALATSPIPDGVFTASISALSSSGETRTASATFETGTKYEIQASLPAAVEVGSGVTHIAAKVVNYLDSVVPMPINYAIKRDSVVVASGVMSAADRSIDFRLLPSGEYQISFTLDDAALADEYTASTVIYRSDDRSTPVPGTLLWYPSTSVTVRSGNSGKWIYAVDCDTYLLVTVWTSDDLISQKWVKANAGMHTLEILLPESIDDANVAVSVTGNHRRSYANLTVKRAGREKGLKFVTESFRDRLRPGEEETWTFKVVDNTGGGQKAAVILDMYNTALNTLATHDWKLRFETGGALEYSFYANNPGAVNNEYFIKPVNARNRRCPNLLKPGFNTYGLSFAYGADGADDLMVVREMKNSVNVRIRGVAGTGAMTMKMADFNGTEESVAEDSDASSAFADAGISGINESGDNTGNSFSYRDSEVPLAFFAPSLSTDADGNLAFTFTVPNANTTWGFRALAYTDSLLSTDFAADVLANKPVMVQPNLPRFLRAGDKAQVLATVMNGSEDEQVVTTTIEIFNPVDGSVISDCARVDSIAPSATVVASVLIDAPACGAFIGYRVKSSNGDFADGEQAMIPLLPATTPVIETYPFYISPDSLYFSMRMPLVPADAQVTLQFCENPAWYVVTALPGLLNFEPSTANEAAASIFSAAIASGLLRDNPVIAETLKEWERGDKSDSALTSMLERNEDLKIMLLSATPWMLDAKSDTERMTRLSLLFDKKTVDRVNSAAIGLLKRLECDGGGWAWYSQGNGPSQWATENVLMMMGRLRSLGYLPNDKALSKMILSAIGYMDKRVARQYKEHPQYADYTTYIYMRDYFKGFTSTGGASQAINATVQRILKKWPGASVFEKAVYARILFAHGYPAVAGRIMDSLREYSQSSPDKGMWWPSLDNMTMWSMGKVGTTAVILESFAAIEPGCKDIDLIRQWLILQKESMDWGVSVTTSAVVAAILSTSGSWYEPSSGAVVSVGDSIVTPASEEAMTGYFRLPLSASVFSGKELHVAKGEGSPSWGAVFCRYTDSITSVRESGCDAVNISKTVHKMVSGKSGVSAETVDTLRVGDRIKVQLTLIVERDMDYVAIVDDRPACYEPVEQLPKPIVAEGIYFYRENRDSSTRFFITHLPKGTYILSYDMWVNNAGSFTSGIATVQSQYAPQLSAHSSGGVISVVK